MTFASNFCDYSIDDFYLSLKKSRLLEGEVAIQLPSGDVQSIQKIWEVIHDIFDLEYLTFQLGRSILSSQDTSTTFLQGKWIEAVSLASTFDTQCPTCVPEGENKKEALIKKIDEAFKRQIFDVATYVKWILYQHLVPFYHKNVTLLEEIYLSIDDQDLRKLKDLLEQSFTTLSFEEKGQFVDAIFTICHDLYTWQEKQQKPIPEIFTHITSSLHEWLEFYLQTVFPSCLSIDAFHEALLKATIVRGTTLETDPALCFPDGIQQPISMVVELFLRLFDKELQREVAPLDDKSDLFQGQWVVAFWNFTLILRNLYPQGIPEKLGKFLEAVYKIMQEKIKDPITHVKWLFLTYLTPDFHEKNLLNFLFSRCERLGTERNDDYVLLETSFQYMNFETKKTCFQQLHLLENEVSSLYHSLPKNTLRQQIKRQRHLVIECHKKLYNLAPRDEIDRIANDLFQEFKKSTYSNPQEEADVDILEASFSWEDKILLVQLEKNLPEIARKVYVVQKKILKEGSFKRLSIASLDKAFMGGSKKEEIARVSMIPRSECSLQYAKESLVHERNVSKLLHDIPGILKMDLAKDIHNGEYTLISPYFDKGDLVDLDSSLSLIDRLQIAQSMIQTVKGIHERGICHLDIKHDNILIDNDGRPVLIDYDFSCNSGTLIKPKGSLGLVAPEMFFSWEMSLFPSREMDVWSLGMTLHRLLIAYPLMDLNKGLQEMYRELLILNVVKSTSPSTLFLQIVKSIKKYLKIQSLLGFHIADFQNIISQKVAEIDMGLLSLQKEHDDGRFLEKATSTLTSIFDECVKQGAFLKEIERTLWLDALNRYRDNPTSTTHDAFEDVIKTFLYHLYKTLLFSFIAKQRPLFEEAVCTKCLTKLSEPGTDHLEEIVKDVNLSVLRTHVETLRKGGEIEQLLARMLEVDPSRRVKLEDLSDDAFLSDRSVSAMKEIADRLRRLTAKKISPNTTDINVTG